MKIHALSEESMNGVPYVIISGKGRSGSNRLLDILDASPLTTCRNEVNEIEGSNFFGINGELFGADLEWDQLEKLQSAIANASKRRSVRDRFDQVDKAFLNTFGKRMLVPMSKTKARKAFHRVGVMQDPNEWRFPDLGLKSALMPQTRLVLKLNSCPGWTVALVKQDPECLVIHNIRHPAQYLQSWYNRFIHRRTGTASFEENFKDVPKILGYFNRSYAEDLRQPTPENLIEVELWRWRFVNEKLRTLSVKPDQYLLVRYDDVQNDVLSTAERIFGFSRVPLDEKTILRIKDMRNTLFAKPHTTSLDPTLVNRLIDKVLEDSSLRELY